MQQSLLKGPTPQASRRGVAVVVVAALGLLTTLTLTAQAPRGRRDPDAGADFSPKPPVQALSPTEQARRFILPPGYRMELVLAEPVVENPVAVAFDGNGRLYVAEMRGYMPDADGTNQHAPVSRISLHESTKGDGTYDRHTVFIDKLVLPRFILPLDGSIVTMETDSDDMYEYRDTDGDGVADRKTLFYSGVGRRGNLEHQQSGFVWGLDNWIYSTYNAFRIRWTPSGIRKETTGRNGGQWGLTQDDAGKMWFVDAGGERGPMNFQVPIHYGSFSVRDQFEPGFEEVWPVALGYADVQGGMPRVRTPIGTLNHFTATCGPDIVRGHRMPDDLRGDLLFAEPVGRLIRRAKISVTDGLTQLRNAYPGSEFVLSTDPLFRPVNLATAPDGTVFVADMYHGIIQESNWTKPGTYLRKKIEQYQFDKVVRRGRIWRLVHDDHQPDLTRPRMLAEGVDALVGHLDHQNGWWRDTAQRLLVLRQDRSVVPALVEKARTAPALVARFHAVWTLEGLGALEPDLVRELLKDTSPQMRIQAMRASESLFTAGDTSFVADVRALTQDPDTSVVIQAMLTLKLWKVADLAAIVKTAQATRPTRGVREIGDQILRPPVPPGFTSRVVTATQREALQRGEAVYDELCYACHGPDGKGAPLAGAPAGTRMAPPLAGSPRLLGHRDYAIRTLLHGLTGPIEGTTFPGGVMAPMGDQSDEWIANVASFVRNSFGNRAAFISAADVARVRAASRGRQGNWTVEELRAVVPQLIAPKPTWVAAASHESETAARALTAAVGAWTSLVPQAAGMWFQVDLSEPTLVSELQFDSSAIVRPPPPRPGPAGASAPAAPPPGAAGGATRAVAPPQPDVTGQPVTIVGYPRQYVVQTSADGATWSPAIAEGVGRGLTTAITFPPVSTRFLRITQTASPDAAPPWSIQNLQVFGPQSAPSSH
jgi:mono/diheme cytochrome c family protein/glucose/arabinose dehydrogenase